jgi:hypothetical protein
MNEIKENIDELDYVGDDGVFHLMCACGHRVSGDVKQGDKIDLCPNCSFLLQFQPVTIIYPDRLPTK